MDDTQIQATIKALADEALSESHPAGDDRQALLFRALHQILFLLAEQRTHRQKAEGAGHRS